MEYKLYTTVDITNTGQYRAEPSKESDRWREQNFQTVLQTLGMRSNISYTKSPHSIEISGHILGFKTSNIIRVWQFNFYSERENFFEKAGDPVGNLIEDFDGIPYIAGLDESMEQNYDVFVTEGPARNIIFQEKV
jgi:hypothetical protein